MVRMKSREAENVGNSLRVVVYGAEERMVANSVDEEATADALNG